MEAKTLNRIMSTVLIKMFADFLIIFRPNGAVSTKAK